MSFLQNILYRYLICLKSKPCSCGIFIILLVDGWDSPYMGYKEIAQFYKPLPTPADVSWDLNGPKFNETFATQAQGIIVG